MKPNTVLREPVGVHPPAYTLDIGLRLDQLSHAPLDFAQPLLGRDRGGRVWIGIAQGGIDQTQESHDRHVSGTWAGYHGDAIGGLEHAEREGIGRDLGVFRQPVVDLPSTRIQAQQPGDQDCQRDADEDADIDLGAAIQSRLAHCLGPPYGFWGSGP